MDIKLLKAQDYRRMPWKNGGGITVEIAIHPENASVDNFDWRISMASVPADGPFSLFQNIERTLVLLEGQGMTLHIDGQAHVVTPAKPIVSFSGEADCHAVLHDGPIEDLNTMTRKGKFQHGVQPLKLDDTVNSLELDQLDMLVCLSPKGTVIIEDQKFDLNQHDCFSIKTETPQATHISGAGSFMKISLIEEK